MSLRHAAALALSLLVSASAATPAWAKDAGAPTAPGHYDEWGPDIDAIDIARTFRLADYGRVAVEPLATDAVTLPPSDENTYEPVKTMLGRFSQVFADSLRDELSMPVALGDAPATDAGALRLRGKVLLLDPGSRAKRYWGGFGAGAVRVEIHCELVDAASGEVLLSFTQQRRSGFGGFGGGYEALMARTIRQIGGDVANLLGQF